MMNHSHRMTIALPWHVICVACCSQMRRVPTPVKSPEPSPPPPDPSPPPREPTPPRPQSPEAKAVAVEVEDEEVPDLSPRARQEAKIGVYYKEGQSTDKCLVANSAKRVSVRRSFFLLFFPFPSTLPHW